MYAGADAGVVVSFRAQSLRCRPSTRYAHSPAPVPCLSAGASLSACWELIWDDAESSCAVHLCLCMSYVADGVQMVGEWPCLEKRLAGVDIQAFSPHFTPNGMGDNYSISRQ